MSYSHTIALAAAWMLAGLAGAQTISWNFGDASGSGTPSSDTLESVTAGEVARGNNNGTTTLLTDSSASSGYPGASGGYNAGAAVRAGSLNTNAGGSAYFECALTPAAGCTLSLTNLSFGTRSTLTGPQAFCVRSSLDGYACDLAAGTLTNNSTWSWKNVPVTAASTEAGASVTVRVYGYGGTGSPSAGAANWRIDDLAVAPVASGTPLPVPPSIGTLAAQRVRVGQTLVLALAIMPTDGDPVDATNVTASAGVAGAWSLADGLFSYAPTAGDLGERTFTFTVTDKDGTSAPRIVAVSVLRRQTAAVRMASANGSYAQDFNALAMSGTSNEWDNAAAPQEAWYAYANAAEVAAYRAGSGGSDDGGLYSFGVSGSADRSMGSLASSGKTYRYGVALTNETEREIGSLSVRFTAEQWRTASGVTNMLAFDCCVTNGVLPLHEGVWQRVEALCFCSPVVTNVSQSVGAVYQSAELCATLASPIAPGQVVILRWTDVDDTGSDHALGIDDLSVSWSERAVREGLLWLLR